MRILLLCLLAIPAHSAVLNWHTDLEKAKAEAKERKLPILSLHLLGRLDEDLSCANSRFFRAVLYPNAQVSKYMAENFVLHWKSVRPVPKVTIEFGDGRKIQTTITGNSIHYLLDEKGTPLDALPGLYSPKRFIQALHGVKERPERKLAKLRREWKEAHLQFGLRLKNNLPIALPSRSSTARSASVMAITKSVSQGAIVRAITPEESKSPQAILREDPIWTRLSENRFPEVDFDVESLSVIRKQLPNRDLEPTLETLRRSISQDTIWNEFYLRANILSWLAAGTTSLDELNERVYRELFLTPSDDPWMGLLGANAYHALPNNGVTP